MEVSSVKTRIGVVTTGRADYGLLYPLMIKLVNEPDISMKMMVTGSHLSKEQGYTVDQIRKDGFVVDYEINSYPKESSKYAISISISKGVELFTNIYEKEELDAVIVLGDRYELIECCIPALMYRIPIIHIHGGELTEGALDDSIRHAVSKLASVHFASMKEYGNRLIQMGEDPKSVHVVGALGIDNIKEMKFLRKDDLEKQLGVDLNKKRLL